MEPRITVPGIMVHNRCYELVITIPPGWRNLNNVPFEVLFQAHRSIYCFPLGAVQETECDKCGKILTIERNEPCGYSTDDATGWERFVYRMRPGCSSTRNHFEGKPIIAALVASSKSPAVLSNPFVVIAKEQRASTKRRQAERMAAEAAAAALVSAKGGQHQPQPQQPPSHPSLQQSPLPPPSSFPAAAFSSYFGLVPQTPTAGASLPTTSTTTSPTAARWNPFSSTPIASLTPVINTTSSVAAATSDNTMEVCPPQQLPPSLPSLLATPTAGVLTTSPTAAPMPPSDTFYVTIRRFDNSVSESILKQISVGFLQQMQQVAPRAVIKFTVSGNSIVSVSSFESAEQAKHATEFSRLWLADQYQKNGLHMLSEVRF